MLRIKQLVVIAGPSCAGKTFLLARIRHGRCDRLCAQLGMTAPSSWPQMQAAELEAMPEGDYATALVHFDFYTLDVPGGYRVLPKLLDNAQHATILTLCSTPETLVKRNSIRLRKGLGEFLVSLLCNPMMLGQRIHLVRWLWKRHRIYRDPAAVAAIYHKWANFVGERDVAHYWLNSEQSNASAVGTDESAVGTDETAQVGLFSNGSDVSFRQTQARNDTAAHSRAA